MNKKFQVGEKIETQVVAVAGDTVFIDVGEKSEGLIDAAEFAADGQVSVREGERLSAYFVSDARGELRFTTRLSGEAAQAAGRELLQRAFENGLPIEAKVEAEIKGGFEVRVGETRAFCPYSQMGGREREEAASYVGRVMTFLIVEWRDGGKSLVLSNRAYLEAERREVLSKLAARLKAGAVVSGRVVSLQKYGAFVDIGGFQALLPVSEISHERVADAAAALSVGQEISAKIIRADWRAEKVSLSMKALEKDPWQDAAKNFSVGQKISGKIARVADFGLFVSLAAGIDGLVHVSKLVGQDGVTASTNLKKKFRPGENFSAVIEKIDTEEKRIALNPASSAEQDETAERYLAAQENAAESGDTYNPFALAFAKKGK